MSVAIRVLVAEDNFYTRTGTVFFLRGQDGIDVVGAAADGQGALALYRDLRPDVVVTDLRMPAVDGLRLTELLRTEAANAQVLVLTSYSGDEDIFQALRAGARGYLTKESSGDVLVAAIRAVHAGQTFLPPALAEQMSSRRGQQPLTRREREVLELLADGASNREVSKTLRIAPGTVSVFVSSILSKLGACSRTEAVSIALRRGLLPFDARAPL